VQDTSKEASQAQAAIHRRMGGARKFAMACQMSNSVRSMAHARLRTRHPDFNEVAIRDELIWELYGVRRRR